MVSAAQQRRQVGWQRAGSSVLSPPQAAQAVVTAVVRAKAVAAALEPRMPQALERAEGGWAWVVLLASMVTQGLTLGFPTCIGIFFTELQHEFQASNSETSWFPSILTAMLHAGGKQPEEGSRGDEKEPGVGEEATTALASWIPLSERLCFLECL